MADGGTAQLNATRPVQAIDCVLPVAALQTDELGFAVYLFHCHVAAAARAPFELHHLICSFLG